MAVRVSVDCLATDVGGSGLTIYNSKLVTATG